MTKPVLPMTDSMTPSAEAFKLAVVDESRPGRRDGWRIHVEIRDRTLVLTQEFLENEAETMAQCLQTLLGEAFAYGRVIQRERDARLMEECVTTYGFRSTSVNVNTAARIIREGTIE